MLELNAKNVTEPIIKEKLSTNLSNNKVPIKWRYFIKNIGYFTILASRHLLHIVNLIESCFEYGVVEIIQTLNFQAVHCQIFELFLSMHQEDNREFLHLPHRFLAFDGQVRNTEDVLKQQRYSRVYQEVYFRYTLIFKPIEQKLIKIKALNQKQWINP